jgi:ABC-type bacteriocin/lantibiotic exporter with double-glycine peptidase domain
MSRRLCKRIILGTLALIVSSFVAIIVLASLPPRVEAAARTRAWLSDADYLGASGVRFQQASTDCGVAALEMLLAVPTAKAARLTSWRALAARRDGLTFLDLQLAARAMGVETRGYRTDLAGLQRMPLPAIVHLPDHFVVVDRVSASHVVELRDPSIGRLRMTGDVFREQWTGEVLVVQPRRDVP